MFDPAHQRTVVGAPVALSWQPTDGTGEPADPAGTVTVTVTRHDGTVVVTGQATAGTASEPRTATLPAASNMLLDRLTVTWLVDDVARATTYVDVVGGVLFTRAELLARESSLSGHSTDQIVEARLEVEQFFEDVMNRAICPKLSVVRTTAAHGCTVLPFPDLLAVRSIVRHDTDTTSSTIATADVAAIRPSAAGVMDLPAAAEGFPLTVGFEHGWQVATRDLRRAGMRYCRYLLNRPNSSIPERATSYTSPELGFTATLATPGMRDWHTGIPEVDEVLNRLMWTKPMLR